MFSDKPFAKLSSGEKTALCSSFLNIGRPNDNVEGYDIDIQRLSGLADRIQNLKVPTVISKQRRRLQASKIDSTRISAIVLTNIEPNGVDLNSLNSKVVMKRTIQVDNMDKGSMCLEIGVLSTLFIFALSF